MPGRPAYIVDLFATDREPGHLASRIDVADSVEAIQFARRAVPTFAGAVAYLAVWEDRRIVSVATLEAVGDVPDGYLDGLITP